MLKSNTVGRHSKYSRYKTVNPLNEDLNFDFKVDPEKYQARDPELFRILTLNLNRFPKTFWSAAIFSSILLGLKPDIVFLQEVKNLHDLRSLISEVNAFQFPDSFAFFSGSEFVSGRTPVTLWNLQSCKLVNNHELFTERYFSKLIFFRAPLETTFVIHEKKISFINLHLVSYKSKNDSNIRLGCLNLLCGYLSESKSSDNYIVGGDWNIDSISKLIPQFFPHFYQVNKKFHSNCDYFIISKALIKSPGIKRVKQFKMSLSDNLGISFKDYTRYLTDHYPVILDIPLGLL